MKLSEVLQAVQLIKSANQGVRLHKSQHHPRLVPAMYEDMTMIPGAGLPHQSPYGHLLLHPHYGHRGHLSGLASVAHGLKLAGTGSSGSGAFGSHPPSGYTTGYGGHMGAPSGGHPAPAVYDYHGGHSTGPHAPIADSTGPLISHSSGKSKGSGSSTVTALTLLSFLFFLNILQNCLKDHMETMNPTVMVMTAGTSRTRVSKLAEMNSREQQHTISQSLPQPASQLTSNRGDRVNDAATIIEGQSAFSGGHTKIEYSNSNQRPDPEPEYYSPYANRTLTLVDNNYQDRPHRHSHRHSYQRLHGSYSSPSSLSSLSSLPSLSSSSSSTSASSVSSPSAADTPGSNNYYHDAMDPYYMRIN